MRKLFVILALFVMIFFVFGCTNVVEKVTEEQVEAAIKANAASHGEDVDVEIDANNNEMTIETTTEDGDAKVIVKSDIKNTDDWCMEGSNWNYEATTDQGNANAEWKVVGLINSGEYKGLCHVKYTPTGPEGDAIMDYYFSEDGESGYFEMNVGDQVIKQEWSNN